MKKHLSTIFIALVFLIGLFILLYPSLSNWYNEKKSSYVVSNYSENVDTKTQEEYAEIMAGAKEYNKNLHEKEQHFISGKPEDPAYINALDVYNGTMGYVTIDSIGVKIPISHGTDEDVLQTEVGHLEGSSLPTGEIGNNTVLTGHTGLPSAKLFTDLSHMVIGDTFEIHILDEIFTYKVFNIVIVEPYQVDDLRAIEGKDVVTLITCTPYGVNSHRLLVQGEQVIMEEEIEEAPEESPVEIQEEIPEKNITAYTPIITIPILIILLILIIKSRKRGY